MAAEPYDAGMTRLHAMYRVTGPERSESSTRHSGSSSAATDVVSVRFAQHYRGGASVASVRLGSAAIVPYPASSAHPLSVLGTVRIPLDAFYGGQPGTRHGRGRGSSVSGVPVPRTRYNPYRAIAARR